MKYSEARPLIQSGDLLAWSHRDPWWRSWRDFKIAMVRAFTQSEYSHVGTAWVIGNRVFVVEAVMPLVRIFPLSKTGEFYHLPLQASWSDAALNFALAKVGHHYSQIQAMQAFFDLPQADDLWECAELARAIAKQDGIDLGNKATPTAVVRAAQLRGATCTLVTPW
jgi:hypothetical protein